MTQFPKFHLVAFSAFGRDVPSVAFMTVLLQWVLRVVDKPFRPGDVVGTNRASEAVGVKLPVLKRRKKKRNKTRSCDLLVTISDVPYAYDSNFALKPRFSDVFRRK